MINAGLPPPRLNLRFNVNILFGSGSLATTNPIERNAKMIDFKMKFYYDVISLFDIMIWIRCLPVGTVI